MFPRTNTKKKINYLEPFSRSLRKFRIKFHHQFISWYMVQRCLSVKFKPGLNFRRKYSKIYKYSTTSPLWDCELFDVLQTCFPCKSLHVCFFIQLSILTGFYSKLCSYGSYNFLMLGICRICSSRDIWQNSKYSTKFCNISSLLLNPLCPFSNSISYLLFPFRGKSFIEIG